MSLLTPSVFRLSRGASQVSAYVKRHRALIQCVLGGLALVLGMWGWSIQRPPHDLSDHFNNLFGTLQLITFNFPQKFENDIPWQLQVARLLAPLVAVFATLDVLVGAVTRPLRLAVVPYMRDHLVIAGDTKLTDEALLSLAGRGRDIVAIGTDLDESHRETLEGLGLTAIKADPAEPAILKDLGIKHAAAIFLTSDDDIKNLDLALLAIAVARDRVATLAPLVLAVLIDRESLAIEVEAALDGIARRHRVRYRRLCPDREGLALEMARFAPVFTKPDRSAASHVLIIGLAGRWEQIVMQLVVSSQDHPSERPILTFVLDTKNDAPKLEAWRALHPDLDLVAQFEVMPATANALPSAADVATWRERCCAPHLVIVIVDDKDAISAALTLRRKGGAIGTDAAPMLVHRSKKDRLLGEMLDTGIDDRDVSRMVPFGGLVRAQSIERMLDRKGDELAIALHRHYLERERGSASETAAIADWDDLPENLREANRSSADHAPILFAAAGLTVGTDGESAPLSDADLDLLARVEHRRWMANRIEHGWHSGDTRDDARRVHPSIIDFDKLSDAEKEKDRANVVTLYETLRASGRSITRQV